MAQQQRDLPLGLICHPYLFALKEGQQIRHDMMDFSLLLLHRNCTEVIRSPRVKAPHKRITDAFTFTYKQTSAKLST